MCISPLLMWWFIAWSSIELEKGCGTQTDDEAVDVLLYNAISSVSFNFL